MNAAQDKLDDTASFTLVTQKITQKHRHNGVFFFIEELIERNDNALSYYRPTIIQRQHATSSSRALLLHNKKVQAPPLLGRYRCLDEHLTFDEWYLKHDSQISAAHYRGLFDYELYTLKVGIYFDQNGNKIHTNIKILKENNTEIPLLEHDPLYRNIEAEIQVNLDPFKTLLLKIINLKKTALYELYRNTTQDDAIISKRIGEGQLNETTRHQLLEQIEALISTIKKINQYSDDIEDMRYIHYEQLLHNVHRSHLRAHADAPVTLASTALEKQVSVLSTTEPNPTRAMIPAKSNQQLSMNHIKAQIDHIIEVLTRDKKIDAPDYEQYLHVLALLEPLELECLSLLWDDQPRLIDFVQEQKSRLGFTPLSFDAYFYSKVLEADLPAVQAFLPLMALYKKMGQYWSIIQAIKEDNTGEQSLALCKVSRFLYAHDDSFQQLCSLELSTMFFYEIDGVQIMQHILTTFMIKNNIEGFLFFLPQNASLTQTYYMIDNIQYNILETCILWYTQHHNLRFLSALFDHGIQVTHPTQPFSTDYIQHCKRAFKERSQRYNKHNKKPSVLNLAPCDQEKISDGLDFAFHHASEHRDLINEIAKHASFELLVTKTATNLMHKTLNLRLCVTNTTFFAVAKDISLCNHIQKHCSVQPDETTTFACIFYNNESNTPAFESQNSFISTLYDHLTIAADNIDDLEKREILKRIMTLAKALQSKPETLEPSLTHVYAALLTWILLSNPDISDYKCLMQLFYLRGSIAGRIYRSNSDQVAYNAYQVGIEVISGLSTPLSAELKQTSIYRLLDENATQCMERMKSARGAELGLFGQRAIARPRNASTTEQILSNHPKK